MEVCHCLRGYRWIAKLRFVTACRRHSLPWEARKQCAVPQFATFVEGTHWHTTRDLQSEKVLIVKRAAKSILLVLASGLALCAASCRHDGHEAVYPVTGKVFYQGQPAEGATVTFFRRGDGKPQARHPGAQVGSDGSFRLSTFVSYDGAPPGRYAVTVVYPSATWQENGENMGPDVLHGRYADPQTTPLMAEIEKGPNSLEPFHLK